MAPATVCVAPSMIRAPSIQPPLQQRHVLQRQAPTTQQCRGQQGAQLYHHQNQGQQHQNLNQQHHPQQRHTQQQHLPRQQQQQPHVRVGQHLDLQEEQGRQQPRKEFDDNKAFPVFSMPCTISSLSRNSGPTATGGAARAEPLSNSNSWCSKRFNKGGHVCVTDASMQTAIRPQLNSVQNSRRLQAGFPPLYLSRSGLHILSERTESGTSEASPSARDDSEAAPFLSSGVCALISSLSGDSDTSTVPGDGSTVASSLTVSLESSQEATVQFSGRSAAKTPFLADALSCTTPTKTPTGGKPPQQQQPLRGQQQQQLRSHPQPRQQLQGHTLPQLPRRQPVLSAAQQQQLRYLRQQRGGGAPTDTESTLAGRQLRLSPLGNSAPHPEARVEYGTRNGVSCQSASGRPSTSRRHRHLLRQQQDQRTQAERQQRVQQLSRQQTHCRCTSETVQHRLQCTNASEAALQVSLSSYPCNSLVSTGDTDAAEISSCLLSRAAAGDNVLFSVEDWNTPRHADSDAALLHHLYRFSERSGSRSSSSLALTPAGDCEAFLDANGGSREVGRPPQPYLYHNLRFGGGAGFTACTTNNNQAAANTGNTCSRISCVSSTPPPPIDSRVTRAKDTPPSSTEARVYAVHASSPLSHGAAAATVRCCPPPAKVPLPADNNRACLFSKKLSFDRTAPAIAQKPPQSAADAATGGTAVAAGTSVSEGINGRRAAQRLQRQLAHNVSLQNSSGDLPPGKLHLTPRLAQLKQTFIDPEAHWRTSLWSSGPQVSANRTKYPTTRIEHWQGQQPTVTLPSSGGKVTPKSPRVPLRSTDSQTPSGMVSSAGEPTSLHEENSIPSNGTQGLEEAPAATAPPAADDTTPVTICEIDAKVALPEPAETPFPASKTCSATVQPIYGEADAIPSVMPRCAAQGEVCTSSRSSDHIGRGRGPGGPDVAPGPLANVVGASPSVTTANTTGAADTAPRTDGLEHTWLRLLCESEAVAEEKVRTCRSSAPIPPAVLLRAPEKLEGHVISSTSRDVLRPPFYSLLQEESAPAGGSVAGRGDAATMGRSKDHRQAARCRADAEQCATKQPQVLASSDVTKSAGSPGNAGAGISIIETLHLEKLLQSAIYGAVFRANLHTVFRSTRASKKPRQGDEDGLSVNSGCFANPTRLEYNKEHDKCHALNEPSRRGAAARPAPAAERSAGQEGSSTDGLEVAAGHSGCLRDDLTQPAQGDRKAGDSHCENSSSEAKGIVELRSEVVAVKVLSLSLQLNASPSLQEDFLSELKFYPYLKGHDNILVPHRIYVDRAQQLLLLVFPFAEFEDLFEVLKKRKKPFAEAEVQWICKQLLQAVLFLHRRGIAMRDLSLENVLMCRCPETGFAVPKLTDPGQAVIADQEAAAAARAAVIMKRYNTAPGNSCCRGQQHKGDRKADALPGRQWCDAPSSEENNSATYGMLTPRKRDDYDPPAVLLAPDKIFGKSFRPPEVYQQCSYNPFKVDSFCMGWMTYYLLTKQQLFQRAAPSDDNWRLLSTKNASDLLLLLGRKNGAVLSVEGLDFVVRLLEDDPQRRMTIYQALTHPFIALSKPRPVLADKLFPEDAATQEQHMAKQRRFHVQLLQQKQSLLQLYNMRWRDQPGLRMVAAAEEVSEQQESTVDPAHDLSHQADKASIHGEQARRCTGMYPVLRRNSLCRAVLRKCAPCLHEQISHVQRQEPCEELWQDDSWRTLPRPFADSAAAVSSWGHTPQLENLGLPVTTQSARIYRGDWTQRSESQMAESVDKQCLAYEELPSERHAPTLLVQHSTLLRGTPPTPSTPCRCWSASVAPIPQKASPPCGALVHIPSTSEKQEKENGYCPEWGGDSACETQPPNDSIQSSEEASPRRKDQQVGFYLQTMSLRTTAAPESNDRHHPSATDVNPTEKCPSAQHCGRFLEQPGYAGCQQHLDGKPTAELSSDCSYQKGSFETKVIHQTPGRETTDCQISHALAGRATARIPPVPVAGLSRAGKHEGVVQLHSKHLFSEEDAFDPGYLGDKHGEQTLPLQTSMPKNVNNGRSEVDPLSSQKQVETKTVHLTSGSDATDTPDKKVVARTGGGAFGPAVSAVVESRHSQRGTNIIASIEPLNSICRSQPSHGPLPLVKTLQDKPTKNWTHSTVERAAIMYTTTDMNPDAVEQGPGGPGAMQLRAGATQPTRSERRCDMETSSNAGKDIRRQQRPEEDPRKAVHSKGRRGPSSSSTETGSTAGEHCGGRSDSDYCVGARSSGSCSTYNRNNVSHGGPQSCVILPAAAVSHGPGKSGRSGGAHGESASAEST